MDYNLRTFIFIGELLVEGTTINSFSVTGLDGFGSIHTFADIADYLNLNGFATKRGKKWTGNSVKVFCHRMHKNHPEVWNEHIQHEHIGRKRWELTGGSLNPQNPYHGHSLKTPKDLIKPEHAGTWCPQYTNNSFQRWQRSLPENERVPVPDDLIEETSLGL